MSYSCVYESTLFYNPADKHSVIRVRTRDKTVPNKAQKAANGRDDFIRFIAKWYNLPQTDKISMILEGESSVITFLPIIYCFSTYSITNACRCYSIFCRIFNYQLTKVRSW